MNADIVVTGIGLVSPVGLSALRSLAAIRAGITRFVEHTGYHPTRSEGDAGDNEGDPKLHVAAVFDEAAKIDGRERLTRLALLALQGLFRDGACQRKDLERCLLLCALPEPDDVVKGWGLAQSFLPTLARRGGVEQWAGAEVCEIGAPGVIHMIERARTRLRAGDAEMAIVLAADTYVDQGRLAWLDAAFRLKSPRNVDGFIPGECAVALLVETARSAERRGARPRVVIGPSGFGAEPRPIGGELWSTGKGLSDAIRAVLASESKAGGWTLCNLNGETYRAREWALVMARLGEVLTQPARLDHPAEVIGEVGTAMAGLLVASFAHLIERDAAPSSSALLWAASDGASRAALALQIPS